jgi:hypothetical protein
MNLLELHMNKFDKNKNTIWVDMDGVIADFDAFVLDKMGRTFDHASGPDADKEMWDFLTKVGDLYFKLEPTPYAKELWDFVNSIGCDVQILTAIPRRTTMPDAEEQKKRWLAKHREIFGDNVKFNIGPFSRDKWKHAKPNDILIDDRYDNITDWMSKGDGIGIFHNYRDVSDTIKHLKSCLG